MWASVANLRRIFNELCCQHIRVPRLMPYENGYVRFLVSHIHVDGRKFPSAFSDGRCLLVWEDDIDMEVGVRRCILLYTVCDEEELTAYCPGEELLVPGHPHYLLAVKVRHAAMNALY